jgi:uncharacterized protein YPO0396
MIEMANKDWKSLTDKEKIEHLKQLVDQLTVEYAKLKRRVMELEKITAHIGMI